MVLRGKSLHLLNASSSQKQSHAGTETSVKRTYGRNRVTRAVSQSGANALSECVWKWAQARNRKFAERREEKEVVGIGLE